jgi:hypothetical protein
MKRVKRMVFGIAVAWVYACSGSEIIYPTQSAQYIDRVAPTTRPWYEPDDSLVSLNAGWWGGKPDAMIRNIKDGLMKESFVFAWTHRCIAPWITEIPETLYRSGDSPEITNILHQSLLFQTNLNCGFVLPADGSIKASGPDSIQTNLYRDIILHAYIMASPVPMTFLAETVVKNFPAEQRLQWYRKVARLSFDPSSPRDTSLIDRPSREALRFMHFLFTVRQIETDPECLRVLGNPRDPKRE